MGDALRMGDAPRKIAGLDQMFYSTPESTESSQPNEKHPDQSRVLEDGLLAGPASPLGEGFLLGLLAGPIASASPHPLHHYCHHSLGLSYEVFRKISVEG